MANYLIAQLDEIEPGPCPCGLTRRAFAAAGQGAASVHLVEIQQAAQRHYHKKLTEIYLVLEGRGEIELDGRSVPVKPFTAVLIKPGCRHRAIGELKIINISIPSFDPSDEWLD